MKNKPELVGPSAAARELGVSTQTVRTWGQSGVLPVVMTADNKRLYPVQAVQRLAVERQKRSQG